MKGMQTRVQVHFWSFAVVKQSDYRVAALRMQCRRKDLQLND